jgi:thioredoxin-like negative regulator of GroEL
MVMFWYGGSKQDGINQLVRCAQAASITAPSARLSLADIYIEEKQPEKARSILDSLITDYPHSRFVKWTLVKYFLAVRDTTAAIGIYGELSASYDVSKYGKLNSLKTLYAQIRLLCAIGNTGSAQKLARKALEGKCLSCTGLEKEECVKIRKLAEKDGCHGVD